MSHTDPVGRQPRESDDQVQWDRWFDRLLENIHRTRSYEIAIDPTSVAVGESTQSYTVNGITTDDVIMINKPTKTADLSITDAFVSADNTLSITFRNFSGGPIDPPVETYRVIAIRL